MEDDYFEGHWKALGERAQKSDSNLVLMGRLSLPIRARNMATSFRFGKEAVAGFLCLRRNRHRKWQRNSIEKGALWNGGVFAFRLGYVLERAHELDRFSGL